MKARSHAARRPQGLPSRSLFRNSLPLAILLLSSGVSVLRAADPPRVEEVVLVFKTHFDIGYTDLASAVVARYRTSMIDEALDVVDSSRALPPAERFAWTLPGWPLARILEDWPGQTPERKARVRTAFHEGRFVVHALPFTTHTELLEPEDLVRGLGFSSRLSRDAGLDLPRDAKMTDVPCHSSILVTLLVHAGVEFLHLGCNAASASPELPRLFFWEGPDGSRLLTMYTAESYGTGLVPPVDWPCRTWLALVHTGDNHGPPRPEEVRKLLDEAREKLPGVRVRIGRLSDFADRVRNEPGIPVVRGDMPDTWIHGPLSDPVGAALARSVRPAIGRLEALATSLEAWGLPPVDVASKVASAYEQSLLYGEHTWGGALYWVTSYSASKRLPYGEEWAALRAEGRFAKLEASWAEHTAYIESARDTALPALESQLSRLASAVAVEGDRVLVQNPLPWRRDGVVTVALPPASWERASFVRPADGGDPTPLSTIDGRLVFVAREVPALGYRCYVAAPEASSAEASANDPQAVQAALSAGSVTIRSPFYALTLDRARGAVASIVDLRSRRELVRDSGSEHGFGRLLHQRFSRDDAAGFVKDYVKIDADWALNELGKPNLPPASEAPHLDLGPASAVVERESTPLAERLVLRAPKSPGRPGSVPGLPYAVTTRITLWRDLPAIDFAIEFHDKPADPWPEGGWLPFSYAIESPRFLVGRPGAILDPARDIVRGSNRHLLGVHTGVAVLDPEGRGVGLCPIDSPLVSLGRPGLWTYSRDFVPHEARIYVNLFNNQWTTNFRLWSGGTWTSRVRLWSIDGGDPAEALITPAIEARWPLASSVASGPAGRQALTRSGLELSRKGVLLLAFGANPDGEGLIVRFWEALGSAGECRVRLPDGLQADLALPIDLRGRPRGKPIPIEGGAFAYRAEAFAPASFALRRSPPSPR